MSTTTAVQPSSEKVVISLELYNIIEAINENVSWQSIFAAHCSRTGKPVILPEHTVATYVGDRIIHEYHQSVTWQGRKYLAFSYISDREARKDLFRGIVQSIISQELKEAEKLSGTAKAWSV